MRILKAASFSAENALGLLAFARPARPQEHAAARSIAIFSICYNKNNNDHGGL